MKPASWKDLQLCARTKLPVEVAQVVTALAKEQRCTEYIMIRRLLYMGLWAAYNHNDWTVKTKGYQVMTAITAAKVRAVCKARMREARAKPLQEAEAEI